LFKSGKNFSVSPLRVTYFLSNGEKYILQCGFGVSAKVFKKAVDRNRLKRLMREVYRLQKQNLKQVLQGRGRSMIIFYTYTGNRILPYKEIYKSMESSLKRLEKIANENADANS
jgi:ribonuclease P protein component